MEPVGMNLRLEDHFPNTKPEAVFRFHVGLFQGVSGFEVLQGSKLSHVRDCPETNALSGPF